MQVYKATRGGVATVAVKVMGETSASQRQANKLMEQQELFEREIHLLKSCRDKNIVQFLGACMQVGGVGPQELVPVLALAGLSDTCKR